MNAPTTPLRVRPARADEVEQLARVHAAGFPDERSRDARRRLFLGNARGTLEDLYVAERRGEICAHAFLFRAGIWLGGREVPCAAVASLAVAPTHRGTGVASALMNALHEQAHTRGEAVTLLYPFKHGFYGARGYGLAARVVQLRTRTRSLPRDLPGARAMSPATSEDVPRLRSLYASCCAHTSGMLSRPERLWQAYFADETRHWAVLRSPAGGDLEAAVSYGFVGHADEIDGPLLRVHEHFARDAAGRASIWAFLARQRDQCATVEIPLAEGDPLPFALAEPAMPGARKLLGQMQPLGTLAAGAMLRVLSLARALEARGYEGDGALDVEVLASRGANATRERVGLEVRDGAGRVGTPAGVAMFRTDRSTFAAVFTGALSPDVAVRAGMAEVEGDGALRIAQRVFALPPPHTFDAF